MPRLACALVVLTAGLGVLASSAVAACSAPVLSGGTATVKCSSGLGQTVSVPDHAGAVTLTAFGGDGGLSGGLSPYYGAAGGVQAALTQSGSFMLTIDVATAGTSAVGISGGAGGDPGGGAGTSNSNGGGGGGGGYSDIIDGSTTLMVAAGGGGGGSSSQWGAGGDGGDGLTSFYPDGQPGGICSSPGDCFAAGGGATETGPGAGESHPSVSGDIVGNSGSGSTGGAAGATTGGGGGGGGYFGGGGGGTSYNGTGDGGGGGGGGSTFTDPSLSSVTPEEPPGGDGVVTVSYTLPTAPTITSAGSASFTIGAAGTYTITSTGAPAATISLDDPGDLPAGLTFTPGAAGSGTGTISGTPTGASGTANVTVRASNGQTPDATQTLSIVVSGAAPPPGVGPAITSAGTATFTVGSSGSYALTSTGTPTPVISLDDPTDLPPGLSFAAGAAGTGAGTISGTPTGVAGTFTITVRAHNGVGADATQRLSIDVASPSGTKSVGGGYLSLGGGSSGGGSSPVAAVAGGVGVTLGCAGQAGKSCSGQVAVSVRERRHGKKVVAVLAKPAKHTVTAVVGKATYKIASGQIKVVKVTLNGTGRSLLKRFHRLTVQVVVSVSTANGLDRAATKTVTIKVPAPKRKRK